MPFSDRKLTAFPHSTLCSVEYLLMLHLRLLESSLYSFPSNNKRPAQDRPRTILLIYPNASISGPISSFLLPWNPPVLPFTNVSQSNIQPKKTKQFGAATEVFLLGQYI